MKELLLTSTPSLLLMTSHHNEEAENLSPLSLLKEIKLKSCWSKVKGSVV